MKTEDLIVSLAAGEGYRVEFKEKVSNLDRELVSMANCEGGSIYLGVRDDNSIKGIAITNKLLSQVQDIARNCDPPIDITCVNHDKQVLEVIVSSGVNKPYRCKDGFFMRAGANAQKMTRDEICDLIIKQGNFHYDELVNQKCSFKESFDLNKYQQYLKRTNLNFEGEPVNYLMNIGVLCTINNDLFFNNSGILFFSEEPQKYLPESNITCVLYKDSDRFHIIDRQEVMGSPIDQIEMALQFCERNNRTEMLIHHSPQRNEHFEYPLDALREVIINAVMHRDYYYDASHIYIHIHPDHIEVENPGGLYAGLSITDLGKRSIRRNRLIAELLFRAKYVEKVGSGIPRIKKSLFQNGNPPAEFSCTNFFSVRLFPRVSDTNLGDLTPRQVSVMNFSKKKLIFTKKELATFENISEDTALREIKALMIKGLIAQKGVGRGTYYTYDLK